MADKYTKTLSIKTVVDEKQWKQFSSKFKQESTAMKLLNEKDAKALSKNYADAMTKMEKIKKLKEAIEEIQLYGGKGSRKAMKELQKQLKEVQQTSIIDKLAEAFDSAKGAISKKIVKTFEKAGEKIADFIKDSFKAAFNELKTMSSYNLGTTLFQSQEALSTSLQYGLSGGQSYALNKALEFFGASSVEDTYYWNENQREAFAEKIGYYTDKFNSLNNSDFFQQWDRFVYDFKTFKEDVMYDIMDWIMSNKETIQKGFQALSAILKWIAELLAKLTDWLKLPRSQSQISSATSDIISNYSNSSNTNNNLTVNNTFNGVQSSNKTQLVNAGELTYLQLKEALYGY